MHARAPTNDLARCGVGDGVTAAGKHMKQQKQTNKQTKTADAEDEIFAVEGRETSNKLVSNICFPVQNCWPTYGIKLQVENDVH